MGADGPQKGQPLGSIYSVDPATRLPGCRCHIIAAAFQRPYVLYLPRLCQWGERWGPP